MNAESILAIPLHQPERLFTDKAALRKEFLALLKLWHPDVNKDKDAGKVASHITALYERAVDKAEIGIWESPNLLSLLGDDGRERHIRFRTQFEFELGRVYVGDSLTTFVIPRQHEKLIMSGLRCVGTIRFPTEDFRKSLESYFPKVEHIFDTKDDKETVICIRKDKKEVLLSDLITHLGGKIDPKHVAWIVSRLFNLASFLHINEMSINGIVPQTVYVSAPTHSLSILGGWWYAAKFGKPIATLPPETYKLAPRKLLIDKKASSFLDLESIRAIGRACLGDVSGNSFRMRDDIPKPMASFLMLPPAKDAITDYEDWRKVLTDCFGPRKFVKLEVSMDDIYTNKENA